MIAKTYPRPDVRIDAQTIKEKYGVDTVYLMHQNESPYGPSPKVQEAIQKEAATLNYYPSMSDGALRDTLAEVIGRGLTRDQFWTGCSGYETIELLMRTYLSAGDEVIITPPTFGAYNKMVGIQSAQMVPVPLVGPKLLPDVEAILAAITEKTKLILLCNPGNPTGTIMVAAEMERLVQAMPDHVLLVSDDVYHQYVTNPDYPDSIQYVLDGKNVVLIHTFSKAYGMAGMRVGYAIAKPEIANRIGGVHRGFHHNKLTLAAAIAAAKDQTYLQETVHKLLADKKWIYEQLDELDVEYIPSETNFILINLDRSSQEVAEALYAYGVITRPQAGELENYLRVTVSTPDGNAQFIHGLTEVLKR